jgi:hypothetical protein
MRHIRLMARSDDYDNDPGFMLKDMPSYEGAMADRGDGLLIAHDVTEHVNGIKNIGPVWDELEAVGGIWQVRGRHGDLATPNSRSLYSPAQNVASDVSRMIQDWEGYNGPGSMNTRAHLYDDDFRDILQHARKQILAEGLDKDVIDTMEEYLNLALQRMRTGFNKAQKRHGDRFRGFDMFCRIRDAVAAAYKMIEWEGQEFVLSYSWQEARVTELYLEDWE